MSCSEENRLFSVKNVKKVDIEFSDIRYSVTIGKFRKQKIEILHGVSGKFNSGELTAIMGPSGSGKSSLLNVLTGFITSGVTGEIMSNGFVLKNTSGRKGQKENFNKQSVYILQDDHLWPDFTVDELMNFASNLKIGYCLKKKEKQILIFDILDTLGLTMSRDTLCKHLSGGQRKRVSIAVELLDNPSVLFLDEPTTGLDISSTVQCISLLQRLARHGQTVICTIHQPSAYILSQFDHVYLLSKGLCVYQGTSENIVPYLHSLGFDCPQYHNPVDYMMEVVCGEHGDVTDQLVNSAKESHWRKSVLSENNTVSQGEDHKTNESILHSKDTRKQLSRPSELQNFCVLLKRCFIAVYRDWATLAIKMGVCIIVGILIGIIFEGTGNDASKTIQNVACLFCSTVYLFYTTMFPSVLYFPMQVKLIRREEFNNWYKLRTFYIAFLVVMGPITIFFAMLNMSIIWVLTNQPMEISRFCLYVLPGVISAFWGEAVGMAISTICETFLSALFWSSIYFAFSLIFSGFLCLFPHTPTYMLWCSYSSAFRYIMQSFLLSIYDYDRERLFCPEDEMYCHLRDPDLILKEMGVPHGIYWIDVGVLFAMLSCVRLATYFTLKKYVRSYQT